MSCLSEGGEEFDLAVKREYHNIISTILPTVLCSFTLTSTVNETEQYIHSKQTIVVLGQFWKCSTQVLGLYAFNLYITYVEAFLSFYARIIATCILTYEVLNQFSIDQKKKWKRTPSVPVCHRIRQSFHTSHLRSSFSSMLWLLIESCIYKSVRAVFAVNNASPRHHQHDVIVTVRNVYFRSPRYWMLNQRE